MKYTMSQNDTARILRISALIFTMWNCFPAVGFADCEAPTDSEAIQKYKTCAGGMSINAEKGLVIDGDKGEAYVVDAKDGGNPKCYKICTGQNSHGGTGNAELGNEKESNKTPPGMLLTFKKTDSSVFKSPDEYVGLNPTNNENNLTSARGVLLHACNGEYTKGCIGFKDGKWPEIKKLIQGQNNETGTPVYVYAKSMKGDGCPNGGGGRNGVGSSNSGLEGTPAEK